MFKDKYWVKECDLSTVFLGGGENISKTAEVRY